MSASAVGLRIGGVAITLHVDDRRLPRHWDAFRAEARPDLVVHVVNEPPPQPGWSFSRAGMAEIWETRPGVMALRIAPEVYIPGGRTVAELALDTTLRVSLARYLAQRGGLVLHASGWLGARGAAVFFGVSGSGKTTTVRAAAAQEYLCDDVIIVRQTPTGWRAYGTPFHGSDGRGGAAADGALVGTFAIVKEADAARIECLPATEALSRLMRCVMLHNPDPARLRGVLDTAAALVNAGHVCALHLGKGRNPWDALASTVGIA